MTQNLDLGPGNESFEPKPEGLKRFSLKNSGMAEKLNLASMPQVEILRLRDECNALLPPTSIKDLDMAKELAEQFHRVKILQQEAAEDDDTPTNQRAQVANTVASTLKALVNLQAEAYNVEQFRKMEAALVRALRTLPKPQQDEFFKAYGKAAEEMASEA